MPNMSTLNCVFLVANLDDALEISYNMQKTHGADENETFFDRSLL